MGLGQSPSRQAGLDGPLGGGPKEDYWECLPDEWRRHHVKTRRMMYTPNWAAPGPSKEEITLDRCTRAVYWDPQAPGQKW